MSPTLAATFNAGDIGAMAALYEDAAVLIDETGAEYRGAPAIEAVLKDMLDEGTVMASTSRFALIVGDIASCSADWRLDPSGSGEVLTGKSVEVLRRQTDGRWLYLIDCPAGI